MGQTQIYRGKFMASKIAMNSDLHSTWWQKWEMKQFNFYKSCWTMRIQILISEVKVTVWNSFILLLVVKLCCYPFTLKSTYGLDQLEEWNSPITQFRGE